MKVVYTEEALKDLDAIADWLIVHYPAVAPVVERRIRSVVAHIARWPESSRRSAITQCRSVVIHTRFSIASRMIRCRYSTSITPHSHLGMSKRSPIPLDEDRYRMQDNLSRKNGEIRCISRICETADS
jgi:plasmid stabilization system protein ParE